MVSMYLEHDLSRDEMAKMLREELMRRQLAGQISRGPADDVRPSPEPSPSPSPSPSVTTTTPLLDVFNKGAAVADSVRPGQIGVSGARAKAENKANRGYEGHQQSVTVTPGLLNLADINKSITDSDGYKSLAKEIDNYDSTQKRLLELAAARQTGPDLTPAVALTDSLFGSNFSGAYKAPKEADLLKQLNDYFGNKLKLKNELAERYKDLVSASKTEGTTTKLLEKLMLGTSALNGLSPDVGSNGLQGQLRLNTNAFMNQYNQDAFVKGSKDTIEKLSANETSLSKANWLDDTALKNSLIAAAKLYPVSDRDMAAFKGSPDVWTSITRGFGKLAEGAVFAEQDRADIMNYIRFKKNRARDTIEEQKRHFAENVGKYYGFDPSNAYTLLNQPLPGISQAPAQSGLNEQERKRRDALLAKKKAAEAKGK